MANAIEVGIIAQCNQIFNKQMSNESAKRFRKFCKRNENVAKMNSITEVKTKGGE